MFEYAKRMLGQCAAFFHDARLLSQPLSVAFDDGFVLPALDLFDAGFFAQTLRT